MAQQVYFEDINVGEEMPPLVKDPVTKAQLVRYAGASGDFNPLHTDDAIGKLVGLEGVIAHGMLIMGFGGEAITRWIPKKYLTKYGVRFGGMTRPGDVITITGKVKSKLKEGGKNIIRCEVVAKDARGEVKVTGEFEASLPSRSS